jgi:hypothetical protein
MRKFPTPPRAPRLPTPPKKHRNKPNPAQGKAPRSNILDHNYCAETGHLTITFSHGGRYRYEGVGKETAAGFAKAESKGKFLHGSIIGKHACTKITD